MRHRLALVAFALAGVCVLPATDAAAEIDAVKMFSGRGVVGGRDRVTRFSADGAAWAPAYIVSPFVDWAHPMTGSKWISFNATKDSAKPFPQPSRYVFETYFSLPTTFHDPALIVNVLSDNSAAIYVNGKFVGSQPCCVASNFKTVSSFPDHVASHFKPGRNTLRFVLGDYGLVGGLDYAARVSWST